jgi:HEPN domain-containing protein
MPPEYRDPTDPAEWLRRARSNLARSRADHELPDVLYEDLCFDAQQAVEKSLKALLVQRKVAFPKTHAIADLLTLVHESGIEVPEEIRQAAALTEYAVEARYPGLSEDVTQDDYAQAVELAERVLNWAESIISRYGVKGDAPQ